MQSRSGQGRSGQVRSRRYGKLEEVPISISNGNHASLLLLLQLQVLPVPSSPPQTLSSPCTPGSDPVLKFMSSGVRLSGILLITKES